MAGRKAPRLGLGRLGEDVADLVEGLQVGHRVAPRRAADGTLVDHDHVVDLPVAVNVVEVAGLGGVLAEPPAERRIERLLDQRALARAAHAGDQAEHAQGKLHGDVAEIVAPGAGQADPAVIGRTARAAACHAAAAGKVIAGETVGRGLHLRGRALEDDPPAPLAGPRPDLDHLVGRADHGLLVLDHDHRIVPVPQLFDGADQLLDVAGVQSDRRLVEHVEHVDQARSQGRGQRHPADLAAAERPQGAVQGQVAQPDRLQVAQPGGICSSIIRPTCRCQSESDSAADELAGVADLHRRDLGNVLAADPRGQGGRPQPAAAAGRTGTVAPPTAEEDADVHLVLPPLEPGKEALKPAKLPLRHALANQGHLLGPQLRERHVDR